MEAADRELLVAALQRDMRLQRLYQEHVRFEERLSHFHKRPFLTDSEAQEQKSLKRRKLAGVDRMMAILAEHKVGTAVAL